MLYIINEFLPVYEVDVFYPDVGEGDRVGCLDYYMKSHFSIARGQVVCLLG